MFSTPQVMFCTDTEDTDPLYSLLISLLCCKRVFPWTNYELYTSDFDSLN
jgi:hypothetical protein